MSLPIAPNTTCDIHRFGSSPPAAPAVAAVPCVLQSDWRGGHEAGDLANLAMMWTHLMLVDLSVDVRDAYTGHGTLSQQDTVAIPDADGTLYDVLFIERVQRNTPHEHKRVYLDRQQPSWPSNDL